MCPGGEWALDWMESKPRVAEDSSPYLCLSEVLQGLPGAALLGVEEPAKPGAPQHPVEQVLGVSARTGTGSQALAAERLDGPCKRPGGTVSL